MRLPANPLVHEIFTWVWLHDLSAGAGRTVTLADVPDDVWDDVAGTGVDAVWLMGVWERSPAGAAIARTHPAMAAAQRAALPDVTDDDVVGSAYCIRDYRRRRPPRRRRGLAVGPRGAGGARRRAGARLRPQPRRARPPVGRRAPGVLRARHGRRPRARPDSFLAVGDAVIARGRDPYFPAWPEVLQLDASLPGRAARPRPRSSRRSPSGATACAATWRCSCSTTCSRARGATGPRRPVARRRARATGRR